MSHETQVLGDRFLADLANAEEPLSQSSMDGYRSLMRRLVSKCPKFPVSFPAFKRYLDDTGKATLETMRRRYDFADRFFNSELVRDLGIPNPCDSIARPGKIVITAVEKRGQDAGGPAAPAAAVLVDPAAPGPEPLTTLQQAGTGVVPTREIVDRYLEFCRLNGASVNTIKSYRRILGLLVEASPTLPPSVDQIYSVLGDPDDYKPNTRRQRYAVLHALFNSATYLALGLPDPLQGVPRPAKDRTKKRKFTGAEIAALLDTDDAQELAFVRLGLDAGPRVGEAASITVDWVEDDELTVDGKNGVRKMPISRSMSEELRALANERGEIFYDERGRLYADQLAERFREHAKRAGIAGLQIGPHTLRRTFASNWINAGGSMRHLQDILGHADVATTEIYVDVVDESVKAAQNQFSPAGRMGLFGDEWTPPSSEGPSSVAAEMVRRQTHEDVRLQMELDYLARNPCVERKNGRRQKELPKEIALLVLQDVEAGYSLSAIVERFKLVYPFSRAWLAEVIKNGRLREMAGLSSGVSDGDVAEREEGAEPDKSM